MTIEEQIRTIVREELQKMRGKMPPEVKPVRAKKSQKEAIEDRALRILKNG